jgi:hypothetical protein
LLDISSLPEARRLEEWLRNHAQWMTLRILGRASETDGETAEKCLDATVRKSYRGPEYRRLVHMLGARVWQDDPDRLLRVADYEGQGGTDHLHIDDQREAA